MSKCKNCLHQNLDTAAYCLKCSIPLNETRIQTGAACLRLKCSDGKTYSISESGSIIGRKGDISFPDDGFMSRNHAKVSIGSGSMSIEDLGSQNGTFVNGSKLDNKQGINVGDRVKCGSTKFTVSN